jgi:hypothetical protein
MRRRRRRSANKQSKSSKQQSNAVGTNLATNLNLVEGKKGASKQDQEEPCFLQ